MLFLIAVCVLASVSADDSCRNCINNLCYTIQPFRPVQGSLITPTAIDHSQNILYLQYKDIEGYNTISAINLNENNRAEKLRSRYGETLKGVVIDQATSDVYMYGDKGLFKHTAGLRTEEIKFTHNGMSRAQFKSKLYYTTVDRLMYGIYAMDMKTIQSELIAPTGNYSISYFVVDKNSDIYFYGRLACERLDVTCNYGVYRLEHGSDKVERLFTELYKLYIDRNEVVHFFEDYDYKIYRLDENDRLVLVGRTESEDFDYRVFDNNDGIYYRNSRTNKLLHLSPQAGTTCVLEDKSI